MENKTYLEILAENDTDARKDYEFNPKDLFVQHNEIEEEQELETTGHNNNHTELENKEEFQKFGGSYHQAGAPGPLKEIQTEQYLKNSVLYEKNIRTHVINIDSRFRADPQDPSTDFTFKLKNPMKNIISLRISSIEFPNTYYTFSRARQNISFTLYYNKSFNDTTLYQQIITIDEGNYSPEELVDAINLILSNNPVSLSYNSIKGKILFDSQYYFEIDFLGNNLSFVNRTSDNGLGYNLGFRQKSSSELLKAIKEITNIQIYKLEGSAIIDTIDNNYIFISLDPDWKVITNYTKDKELHHSFAKVIINVPKGSVLYDNGANTITKEYWFQQPTDITIIPVRISDPYDQIIDLSGMDFSFSLEMKEIRNAALHELIRSK
jgi:hypothetical protein